MGKIRSLMTLHVNQPSEFALGMPGAIFQKRAACWNTSRGSPNGSDKLRYTERGECRLIDCRCHRQSIVSLERCDSLLGHLPKYPIDWSIVITVTLQL